MPPSRSPTPDGTKPNTTDSADVEKTTPGETSLDKSTQPEQNKAVDDGKPSTGKLVLLIATVFLSMFLVAIDRTIVSTAIPRISDEFNSLPDVGWYGSVYLMTCCAFQLLFGKVYTFYSTKIVLLASILIFEAASALCGAAPSSASFIAGRAIAGVGAAGIFAGTIVTIVHAVPLQKRPRIQGLMGALMGLATVMGPLIGGAFTSNVTWRWCFYINLPFGGVAMAIIFFFFKVPSRDTAKLPWTQKLSQLDAPGTSLLIPGVTCLLLALQWGGQTYTWQNGRIIALLTLTGVLLIGFVFVQAFLPKTATVPPRILKYRSVAAAFWSTICIGSSQYIYVYYIPVWFQSVKGVSAVQSGIRLIPLMLGQTVASISGGFINQKMGYYTPLGLAGVCLMSVGAGLLTTLQVGTGHGKWIGYQVLYGLGMGLCFQTPNLATQTVLPKRDVPVGMALMFFGQLIGAAIFVSVGENVLTNQLLSRLSKIPGFSRSLVTSGGATVLIDSLPRDQRGTVLIAYNDALRKVFQIGLIVSCLTILGIGAMEWKNILKQPAPNVKPQEGGTAGGPSGTAAEKSEAAGEKTNGQKV